MSDKKIGIDDLADAVGEALQDYAADMAAFVKEDVAETAKAAVKALKKRAKSAYPKSKEYAKDWKAVTTEENSVALVMTIHSPRHYQLAHLLENGHAKRTGGRVEGRPHILPTAEEATASLEKKVIARIGK